MAKRAISTPGAARAQAKSAHFPTLAFPLTELEHARIEALIEQLIEILDANDGDTDREPHVDDEPDVDDEPSIGERIMSFELDGSRQLYPLDGELDESDSEPSLGWTDRETATGHYAASWQVDLEAVFSDE